MTTNIQVSQTKHNKQHESRRAKNRHKIMTIQVHIKFFHLVRNHEKVFSKYIRVFNNFVEVIHCNNRIQLFRIHNKQVKSRGHLILVFVEVGETRR